MKRKLFLIILIAVFMTAGCSLSKSVSTEPLGVLLKLDKNDKNQAVLVEAVQVLEKLYGTPLVLINGGVANAADGTKVSVVRYSLYFEVSEGMYTVVPISNGVITEIIPVNRASKVLATKKMAVDKVLEASGASK